MPNSIEQGIDIYQSFIAGRQNIQYYDIKDMDVLIEDTSAMSSQYFKIIKMPNQLEGGKNAFFLLGDSEMLEKNTEILIEVLDANGDNIFVEATEYGPDRLWDQQYAQTIADARGGKRCVAVWLQEDAAPGIGKIYVAGIAAKTPSGQLIERSLDPNINKYADKYNVRWSKDIVVEPFRPNSSELIYLDYDRRKYQTLSGSNAISASMYEATWSYSYITSDNNVTLNTSIYYSMASPYRNFQSQFEADGTSPNPVAGEKIPGWKDKTDDTGKNIIKIGVATGSGRQIGYINPQPTFVWGMQAESATKNVSQSLPTPYSTINPNGAGINVQVDDINGLLNNGIESGYGFAIAGKDMWKLMASHSYWNSNTSHSVGDFLYSALYPNGQYHVDGDAETITTDYFYPQLGFNENHSFGPVGNSPISSSTHINTGWADFARPSDFYDINTIGDHGWHVDGSSNVVMGEDGNDGVQQTQGMNYFGFQAYPIHGLIHHFFGTKMTTSSNAPIWSRFSRSGAGTNPTKAVYSHSAHPPPAAQTGQTNQTAYKHALSVQRALVPDNLSLEYIDQSSNNAPSVYKDGGFSDYTFYNSTQKIYHGAFGYNPAGTNQPTADIGYINDQGGILGGLNPNANTNVGGPGNTYGEKNQKFMLWYKPQFDYQTMPFRGYIEPEPELHGKNHIHMCPHPWSFIFTRSAVVVSEEFTDYFTNCDELGLACLAPGMPYFDGEMGYTGMAQGLSLDGTPLGPGDPIGPGGWDPPYPPPPPPAPQSYPKINLPMFLTFLFYDSPTSDSTFSNNFFVGGQGNTGGYDTENPETFLANAYNTVDGVDYQFDNISFFNEWINSGINVSMSYAQQPQRYEVNNIVSYLNFRIRNFQPITGDVYKLKVYKRPKSGIKSWEFMDEVVVERTELLTSESFTRPISPIGFFDSLETVDNNWYTGSGTYITHNFPDVDNGGNSIPISTSISEYNIEWLAPGGQIYNNESNPNANYPPFPTSSVTDSLVLGSLILGIGNDLVSQSWDNVTAASLPSEGNGLLYYPDGYESFSPPLNSPLGNLKPGKVRSFYDFNHRDGITLSTGQTYELSFVAHAKQYAAFTTGSDGAPTGYNPPCLHVYMSGSSFPDTHPEDPFNEHNFGRYVRSYFIHPDQAADGLMKSFGKQYAFFTTNDMASNNRLRFIVTGGQWMLSEVSIKNVSQTGFTPPDFGFQVKLGTEQFGEFMDFKLEMYNWYGLKANKDLYLPNYFVQGGNTYTNNLNNVNQGVTVYTNPNNIFTGDVAFEADAGISIFGNDPNTDGNIVNDGITQIDMPPIPEG